MKAPLPPIEPDLLMLAYRSGIFPMSDHRDDPEIFWVEPRQRAIIPLEGFHLSRSLARTLRRERFTVTFDQAFATVMDACAAPRRTERGQSWISHRIQASYENLHRLGHAHSIECWRHLPDGGRQLAGGLYGVEFDRVFCGESMFSHVPDASKVALAWLVALLRQGDFTLLDCQFLTPHLASLGAVELSQKRYLELLRHAQSSPVGPPSLADAAGVATAGEAAALGATAGSLAEAFAGLLGEAESVGLASSPGKLIAQRLTQTS